MAKPIRDGFHTVTPYLTVAGAAQAIDFYKRAFGAHEVGRMNGPDGQSVMHAEIRIGDSIVMLSDEFPQGNRSPQTLGGTTAAGPKRYLERLSHLVPDLQTQPKVHSLALRLARVAHAGLDVALAGPGSHDWDLAAADLIVHEAGGALTDVAGRGLRYNRPEIVHGALIAAGPARHATLIDLLRDRSLEFA